MIYNFIVKYEIVTFIYAVIIRLNILINLPQT